MIDNFDFTSIYSGFEIVITTKRIQNKKHHKRRINKKWGKRYGFTEYELQEKGKILFTPGHIYMTLTDYNKLLKAHEKDKRRN